MKFRLKYVVEDTDRHGNVRLYYRRHGRKVRLRGPAGSPEFLADYKKAAAWTLEAPKKEQGAGQVVPRSIRWLCVQYYKSAMFKELDPRTQKVRRAILERFCQHKGDGDKPFALLLPRHVRIRRDEMSDRPEAANGMVKAVRQLYRFALRYDLHEDNPAEKVEYLKGNPDGFHSWTLDEIARFEKVHPVGTQARLALARQSRSATSSYQNWRGCLRMMRPHFSPARKVRLGPTMVSPAPGSGFVQSSNRMEGPRQA